MNKDTIQIFKISGGGGGGIEAGGENSRASPCMKPCTLFNYCGFAYMAYPWGCKKMLSILLYNEYFQYRFYELVSTGNRVLSYQLHFVKETLQLSMVRSTMEEGLLQMKILNTLSTAMTRHKTSGPLYHHFLSNGLVWVKSTAS